MKRKTFLIAILLLLGSVSLLIAQQPKMVIEYFENNSGGLYVRAADGTEIEGTDLAFGDELAVGSTLITMKGDYAELRMKPKGTIVRVAENTNFAVTSLQGKDGAAKNGFSVAVGKVKTVVAKGSGSYSFAGSTAVCGVRGTKFIFFVLPGQREIAYVLNGAIDFTNAAGQTLSIGAGMMADALAASFEAIKPPADLLEDLESGMEFKSVKEEEVSGYEKVEPVPVAEAEKPEEAKPAEDKTPKWLQKLMDFLGMEIGTVTIEGETWAKAVVQPRFAFGKLKAGLYLPIIYKSDMFDPEDWYHPDGNDEWSFGTDQTGWQDVTLDILSDAFLKIRYIEWGEQRDPFFLKFGNLSNITVGHGSIMRGYANDLDFPSVRKVGLNLGLDGKKGGIEAMISDAADPQIFGIRPYWKPGGGKFAVGFTALTDLNPEQPVIDDDPTWGKPIFLNGGVDLDLSIVESDALSIVLYGDLAAMVPYFRQAPDSLPTLKPGLAREAVWDGSWPPKNWGAMTGVFGNILVIDYRLEYRYTDGTFRPAFYDALYDRVSTDYVESLVNYLSDPVNPLYDVQSMGVYGELGFTMEKVFYITGGYYWPWPANPASPDSVWPDDTLHLELGILKGLLPLYGSIAMDRKGVAAPQIRIKNGSLETFSFFDENLRFSGEIVYPFSPLLEFALQVTTNVFEDEVPPYEKKVYPSVSILTRLHG